MSACWRENEDHLKVALPRKVHQGQEQDRRGEQREVDRGVGVAAAEDGHVAGHGVGEDARVARPLRGAAALRWRRGGGF